MRERLRDASGFTLPEMMVTIMVMIVVLFALYNIFDMSLRVFSFGNNKVEAVENARLGLERIEREVRAAYPYDKGASSPDTHLFATPLSDRRITFGNDSASGNRTIDPATEEITYDAVSTSNVANPCDAASAAPCTLRRTVGGSPQAVVESLGFSDRGTPADTTDDVRGVRFDYLRRDGANLVTTNVESGTNEVEVVRITLFVQTGNGNRRVSQELSTDVDLRSRS